MAISTDLIKNLEIFKSLSQVELQEFGNRFELHRVPAEKKIVEQGAFGDQFYILLSGSVNVTRNSNEGREVFLNMLGPGDYFGEASLFHEVRRTATVLTQNDVEVIAITRTSFHELFEGHPAAVGRILFHMMKKLFFRVDQMSHELQFRRGGGIDQDAIDKLFS